VSAGISRHRGGLVQIAGNVALVTGGASGLARATAGRMHAGGAKVVILDRDEEGARKAAAELGDGAMAVGGSILDDADVGHAIEVAQGLGPLRMCFAIAGGGVPGGGRTVNKDGSAHALAPFAKTVELNVVGTFNTVRLVAAAMGATDAVNEDGERGAIVTTASIAGYEGQIGQVSYGSAKAAIIGMTLILARDLAALGIRVNCIAPGTMGTEAWDQVSAPVRDGLEAKVPFPRRFGRPDEFAALAEHLVTNEYLNGHVARLDGAIRFDPK
jgi:NAD(P)-dependent dehydrogenase (short-subunit alcohol dehydrogenase family)